MGSKCSIGREEKASGSLASHGTLSVVSGLNETKFEQEYTEGRQISTKVFEVRNKITMRVDVAYKLPKNAMPCKSAFAVADRIGTLQCLEHPNICRLMEAFDDRSHINLIYEKVNGELLLNHIGQSKHLSERKVGSIAWQLVRALCVGATSEKPVLHGALTPRNIMMEKHGEIIVTDLGIIDVVKPDPVHKVIGEDFIYVAPEVLEPWLTKQKTVDAPAGLLPTDPCARKTAACDVWSLGVILFQLLTGKPPFSGKDLKQIAEKVVKGDPHVEKRLTKVSDKGRSIVAKMLRKDPKERPTWEELLEHPWFSGHKDNCNEPMETHVIENLTSTHQETHFKRLVMRMVSEKLPRRQVHKLQQEFAKLDLNGDGMITIEELKGAVLSNPAFADKGQALEAAFKEIDCDNSGKMSVAEFVAATLDTQDFLVHQALWDAFKAIDANHDGKLSKQELHRVVHEMGNRLGSEHVDELSRLVQREVKDGLTFDDFCALMQEEGKGAERKADGMCYNLMPNCERCQVSKGSAASYPPASVGSPRKAYAAALAASPRKGSKSPRKASKSPRKASPRVGKRRSEG